MPEDVEGITSSRDGQRQRRKVDSDGEDFSSDSEGDESDVDEEEEEEEGVESELSARTRQKSRNQRSSRKGKEYYCVVDGYFCALSLHLYDPTYLVILCGPR